MTTLAVIPARLGATRLPDKPLRLLAGLPLVVRVWERVRSMGVAAEVVVATDHQRVVEALAPYGARVVLTRADHPSGTDRVAEVAADPGFAAHDVILNVQGDEPFLSAAVARGAVELVASGRFGIGTAAVPASRSALQRPDVVKVVAADDGRAMYFSRAGIPFLRDEADAPTLDGRVWHHQGVYAYRREALARWVALPPHPLELIERLEQLRPLAAGMAIGVALVAEPPRGGIDTEADLERANADWTELTSDGL